MVYDSFAHYSRQITHWVIDNTFPISPGIATITAGVAWYCYQYGMTHSQAKLNELIVDQIALASSNFFIPDVMGRGIGHLSAPVFVPWLAPIASTYFSIGVSCATSFTLNIIARKLFKFDPIAQRQKMIYDKLKIKDHATIDEAIEDVEEELMTSLENAIKEMDLPEVSIEIKSEDELSTLTENSEDPIAATHCPWKFCC